MTRYNQGRQYIRYADGGEELYNHDTDDHEWTNLAADPKFASVKAEMAAWLPADSRARTNPGGRARPLMQNCLKARVRALEALVG